MSILSKWLGKLYIWWQQSRTRSPNFAVNFFDRSLPDISKIAKDTTVIL